MRRMRWEKTPWTDWSTHWWSYKVAHDATNITVTMLQTDVDNISSSDAGPHPVSVPSGSSAGEDRSGPPGGEGPARRRAGPQHVPPGLERPGRSSAVPRLQPGPRLLPDRPGPGGLQSGPALHHHPPGALRRGGRVLRGHKGWKTVWNQGSIASTLPPETRQERSSQPLYVPLNEKSDIYSLSVKLQHQDEKSVFDVISLLSSKL